jgi:hypothetical protein
MEVLSVELEVRNYHAAKYARPEKQKLETASPLAKAPEFAISFEHEAHDPERILEEEEGVHDQRLSSPPARPADPTNTSKATALCSVSSTPCHCHNAAT